MARNEEKAQGMMNRWSKFTSGIGVKDRGRRPFLAKNCADLKDCQHWRGEILFQIGRKVQEIQNEGLGEHMVRGPRPAAPRCARPGWRSPPPPLPRCVCRCAI
jgi:pre-mRNA-splicing factor ISY1